MADAERRNNPHKWARKLETNRLRNARCRAKDPTYNRANKLRDNYGMTIADYDAMYVRQQGKCAICQDWYEKLHIDHDHGTKKVRELLCHGCNTGIGYLREDVVRIEAAKHYILKHAIPSSPYPI